MSEPLVSVVIPTFNPGPLLGPTLDAMLAQTWKPTEIIVVDDGSSDGTDARLAAYEGRVRVVRQARAGTGAARNAGLREARGAYVLFFDHDDLCRPDMLARQVEVARRHPGSGFVACDGEELEGTRTPPRRLLVGRLAQQVAASGGCWTGDAHDRLLAFCAMSTPGQVLVPRRVLEEVGPLTERREEASDYDLWLRIAARGPVTLHDASLVRWRYRASSHSGVAALRPLRWALMDLGVLERHLARVPKAGRPAVRRALRRRTRNARLAWLLGRTQGMPQGRAALARLSAAAPTALGPRLWWLATWLPPAWVATLACRGIPPEDLATLAPDPHA